MWKPSVSVIVPACNSAATIGPCLESLLEQAYPTHAYDIIVVENGSTDETAAVVQRYPVRLLHSDERGPGRARNLGLAVSEADIVAFTDADCVADPHWLVELVRPYADAQVGAVGGAILAYPHPERTIVERFAEERPPLINFASGAHEFLPHLYTANASYRRGLLNEVGGFNARLVTAEDVDLSWRLQLCTNAQVRHAPRAVIYHRHRSTKGGLARQYRQYGFGEILLDTMYGHWPGYPRDRRHQVRRILEQATVLSQYALSAILRQLRLRVGRTTAYGAAVPQLNLLIEISNIRGKIEGLVATRFMTDPGPALASEQVLIRRFFPDPQAPRKRNRAGWQKDRSRS